MSEAPEGGAPVVEAPRAVVKERASFSLVWLIPIVAALIGGWLGWRAFAEAGPTVTITFKDAEGIESGKTLVKYKDIQVGTVTGIDISEDLTHVVVTAELGPQAERFLTSSTRFWVVRPQISAGRVTGIGTLLSGAYIGIDPVLEGSSQRDFVGLETPPVVTYREEGSLFTLRSDSMGSLDAGAPVYFRRLPVGQIAGYEMDPSGDFVTVQIFVESPHDERITQHTRFWNASGLDLRVTADGVSLETPSFVSMMVGGISFDTPATNAPDMPVEAGTVFDLYPSRAASEARSYRIKRRYILYFDQSVGGLTQGAPVVFRGIRIGTVKDVQLQFDRETFAMRAPVLIEIEPERFIPAEDIAEANMDELVERGMRASLAMGNLLTGQLQVEFNFHPNEPPAVVDRSGLYPVVPTVGTPLDEITRGLADVVAKIGALPLEEIGEDLRASLAELSKTLAETSSMAAQINGDLMPALVKTAEELEGTAASVNQMMAADSPFATETRRAIIELSEAARSARLLADYLERHPEALLQGKRP